METITVGLRETQNCFKDKYKADFLKLRILFSLIFIKK